MNWAIKSRKDLGRQNAFLVKETKVKDENVPLFLLLVEINWFHYFMANRWGNSGNSDRLYFLGLQNHFRW